MNATSKLVKAWESKNAKNAAKAGGVSLMALSLAACGGSSTTTTTSTDSTTDTTTPVATASSLTIGVDTVSGTAGADSIAAARADGVQTWNSADVIDGGAGADTLTATLDTDVTPATGGVTGIETLVVTGIGARTVDFSSATADFITGVTSISNVGSDNTMTFSDITTAAAMTVNNVASATTFSYNDSVLAGTSDSLTLNLAGATAAVTVGTNTDADGDYETLVVNATGAASDMVAGGGLGADATTVTVNASASLDLGTTASFAKVTDFDASGSTAAVTAVFANKAAAGTTAVSIKGGSGDDEYDISALAAVAQWEAPLASVMDVLFGDTYWHISCSLVKRNRRAT